MQPTSNADAPARVGLLTVEVRNDFGCTRVYPADSTARLFAALIGQKTFGPHHVSAIRALGYDVEVQTTSAELPREFQPAPAADLSRF
jgi:hypothetical protein